MWLIVLLLAVCSLIPPQAEAEDTKGLNATLTADKATYAPGEPITLTLRVVNGTSRPFRLSFPTAQRFDLVVEDGQGREIWRWSAGRLFAQVFGEETLKPSGGEFVARATAEGKFPSGTYTVKGAVPALEGTLSATTTLTVR